MAETMIRKQVYLERAQDAKLKRLARERGCTESELIREAVDQLPQLDDDWAARLRADGVLAPKPVFDDLPAGEEAERLRAELAAEMENDHTDYRMTAALFEDRADRL
jgi:Arc/MetJ-type ribon-helix-helix transcriptional regulator